MPEQDRVPALFGHCQVVYGAMLNRSKAKAEAGVTMIVYEGFLTKLILDELNLSTPYYTSVKNALIGMGCIRQLRRGGSSTTSQWELMVDPDVDEFMEYHEKSREPSERDNWQLSVDQKLRDMNRRLERVEVACDLRGPIDFISDPTPPGGIRVEHTDD